MAATRRRRPGWPDDPRGRAAGSAEGPGAEQVVRFDLVELRSFEEFYRAEWGAMVGLAYTLTGSRPVAEDLAQEAMLRAYRGWARVSSYDKPATWVRRVLINLAASRWRRQRSAAKAMLRWRGRAELVVEIDDTSSAVWDAVLRLPRRQCEVIALYYGCDLSVDEVADTLDCAAGTVRTHLVRARSTLARDLDAERS